MGLHVRAPMGGPYFGPQFRHFGHGKRNCFQKRTCTVEMKVDACDIDLGSPASPLQCVWTIWWTRGPPAPLGGLVDLRTSKYYKFPSGLWGPTGWTSLFLGPVLQKPQWTPWWTRSPPKSTTTFARFQDGFRQVRFWLSRLSLQFFSGQNHC